MSKSLEIPLCDQERIANFLKNWSDGRVCVHPTDTIPGLTCQPDNAAAVRRLEDTKRRDPNVKTMVGLVASFAQAQHFWRELPPLWKKLLPLLWPGPLTLVWKSQDHVPSCLVSDLGELALRHPQLREADQWFEHVLNAVKQPLPSTSINYATQAPILGGVELQSFCVQNNVFLPPLSESPAGSRPSSVLRIIDDTHYEWLRKGAFSEDAFDKLYNQAKVQLDV